LSVLKHNLRAIAAYKAAGFCKEGRMRRAAFIGGEWVDLILMASLRPVQKSDRRSSRTPAAATVAPVADLAPLPATAAA
jgi:hypothetical protein